MEEEKKGYFPYWMREPLPDSDRVKYVDKDIILERLKSGEKIRFSPDRWLKVAPNIYFEKDTRLKSIRRNTFEVMKKKEIIIQENQTKWSGEIEIYVLNPKTK